jgi:hypothetical protein
MRTKSGDAIDLLTEEDLKLRRLFAELPHSKGTSVEDRALYGDVAKNVIRHVAVREAALGEVQRAVSHEPQLSGLAVHLESDETARRSLIDQVEKMSRGVHGINLNTGQNFDGPFHELIGQVGTEIEWDLDVALPAVEAWLYGSDESHGLRSARRVAKHAPTNLHPARSRWHERAPIISRFVTIYDHLRDFPRAVRPR